MKKTQLNTKKYLNETSFEYFIRDLFNLISEENYYKRGKKGDTQGGYDIISESGKKKIECKFYSEEFSYSKFKEFIETFLANNNNGHTEKFILCTSCEITKPKSIDYFTSINRKNRAKSIPFKIEVWDINKISSLVYDKELYSLVLRYFSEQEFTDFFSRHIFDNLYGANNSFIHIKQELKSKLKIPFLLDISENIIRDKKLYFNEPKLVEVNNVLLDNRFCLLLSPEGRGKTVISRIISYKKYYSEKFEVYFCDLRSNTNLNEIDYHLYNNANVKQKFLYIFENAHGVEYINEFFKMINKYLESCTNQYFLVNSRYTKSSEIDLVQDKVKCKLNPDITDVINIIKLYEKEANSIALKSNNYDLFFKKIASNKTNNPINLRLLNIYLNTWKNQTNKSLLEVSEEDVYKEFAQAYKLDNLNEDTLTSLQILSCLFQFDIPLYVNRINNRTQYDILKEFVFNGLAIRSEEFFLLLHSIDAKYLFHSICKLRNENSIETSKDFIKEYIIRLADNSNSITQKVVPQIFKAISRNRKDYEDLIIELTDLEDDKFASTILNKLSPAFFWYILIRYLKYNEKTVAFNYYKEHVIKMKDKIIRSTPLILVGIDSLLSKHYSYNLCTSDILDDVDNFQYWIDTLDSNLSGSDVKNTLKRAALISPQHAKIEYEFRSSKKANSYERKHGLSSTSTLNSICINNKFINSLLRNGGTVAKATNRKLNLIVSNGFHFQNVSWARLGKLLYTINLSNFNPEKKSYLVSEILKMILLSSDKVKDSNPKALSLLLENCKNLDLHLYEKFIRDRKIELYVEHILESFTYEDSELYLVAHFYHVGNNKIRDKVIHLIENCSEEDKIKLQTFYNQNFEKDEKDDALYFDFLIPGNIKN